MKPAIFFDRDGTLIYDKVYLNDPKQVEFIPGAIECLKTLSDLGFYLVIVTNQSGVARGLVQLENLEKIHARMQELLAPHNLKINGFFFSPHLDDNEPSRKPNPGMLEEAMKKISILRAQSWMIGDRMTDVEAGRRAGVKTVLLGLLSDAISSPFPPPDFIPFYLFFILRSSSLHFE